MSAEADPPVVAIDDLSLEFPTYRGVIPALAGVTIAVRPGEIVGLVGNPARASRSPPCR